MTFTTSEQPATKTIHGLQYFTGAHSEIRSQYRSGQRPTEFGNKVWATSLILIDHFHHDMPLQKGLRVLEIGCGWGLVGVYLAKVQGCKVTCTDLDPYVLPIVDLHANVNQVSVTTAQAGFLDLSADFLKNFDLIVGAEVCYSAEVAQDLLTMIRRGFQSGVEHIVIADPGRPDFEEGLSHCREFCAVELLELPGSKNGKTTQLLSAKRDTSLL